jgi:hypothetical protein
MLMKEKLVCGCEDPYCILPVKEEDPAKIIEDVEKDCQPIADGCKTKDDANFGMRLRKQILDSMIP